MRKTLLTYVKPHVQEDPLSMILGVGYLAAQMERENIPVAIVDERIETDQTMFVESTRFARWMHPGCTA